MRDGTARPDTCFLFVDPRLRIAAVLGDSTRLYPELPAIREGDELRHFIERRIEAGYVGINETLNVKSHSPLETRLLELASYTLFKTYQFSPRGQVLVLSHTQVDEDTTIITVSGSRIRIELDAADRFQRSAAMLDFDFKTGGMSGFGLIEHIAYSIINAMAVPLIVLNGDGLVLASNEAAQRVFAQGRVRVNERDRLELTGGQTEAVMTFLRQAPFGGLIPLPQFKALGLNYARGIEAPPLGRIFIMALEGGESPPAQVDLLRQRHPALSAGEAQVALALLSGTPPQTIAEQRGVSVNTVRTQVASILRKTNCHTVAAFVAVSRVFIF